MISHQYSTVVDIFIENFCIALCNENKAKHNTHGNKISITKEHLREKFNIIKTTAQDYNSTFGGMNKLDAINTP